MATRKVGWKNHFKPMSVDRVYTEQLLEVARRLPPTHPMYASLAQYLSEIVDSTGRPIWPEDASNGDL